MWAYNYTYPDYICHHGIKGMKWGVRRYQNEDGTLTAAGKKRAAKSLIKEYRKSRKSDPRRNIAVKRYDEEAEIWKALAAGNAKPANDSSTLRGVVKDLIDDRRRR